MSTDLLAACSRHRGPGAVGFQQARTHPELAQQSDRATGAAQQTPAETVLTGIRRAGLCPPARKTDGGRRLLPGASPGLWPGLLQGWRAAGAGAPCTLPSGPALPLSSRPGVRTGDTL